MVTFVVRESGLNELHKVLVLTVIAGIVMEFLNADVVSMYGYELSRLEASDRRQRHRRQTRPCPLQDLAESRGDLIEHPLHHCSYPSATP